MLRLLYKTLLISIMSGSLSIMNMTAFATDTSGATAPMSSNGYSRDANGVLSKTETHHFSGTKKEDSGLMVLSMLAVGMVGARLLKYEKWTVDTTVAAVASAAYVVAEIINIMNLKKQLGDMDAQVTKRQDGKVDQAQIDILEKLKKSYEEVKAALQKKKSLLGMAAMAYAGASVIAMGQKVMEEYEYYQCQNAIVAAKIPLADCVAAAAASMGAGSTEGLACSGLQTSINGYSKLLQSAKVEDEIPGASKGKAQEGVQKRAVIMINGSANESIASTGATATATNLKIKAACDPYLVDKNNNRTYGSPPIVVSSSNGLNKMLYSRVEFPSEKISTHSVSGHKNMLQKILDAFIPQAEAGWASMLGATAGAMLATLNASTAKFIDNIIYTPGNRVMLWGALWGIAMAASQATQEEIDRIDAIIKDIDQILTDLRTLQNGVKTANTQEVQIRLAAFQVSQTADLQLNPSAGVRTDCFTGNGDSNCPSLTNQIRNMPGFANLPSSFQSIASQAANIGNGLSGTNTVSGSTLTLAGQMGDNQNAIKKMSDVMKNKLNNVLKKNGEATIDFNKQENNLLAKLNANTAKVLNSQGISAGSLIAKLGVTPPGNIKPKIASIQTPKTSVASKPGTAAPAKQKGLEFDFKEEGGAEGAFAAAGAGSKDERYDIGENDITKDKGESIFQVISNRYIKSGYPRLLDEIPVKN